MAADDLSAPLGQETTSAKRRLPKLPIVVPWAIVGALSFCLAVFVLWAALVQDPFGGEPLVVVSADQRMATAPKKGDEPAGAAQSAESKPDTAHPGGTPAPIDGSAAMAPPAASGPTVTIIDGSSGKRQEVPIAPTPDGKHGAAVDQRLLETTRHGAIPRIGPDGARPFDVYAQLSAAAAKAGTGANTVRIAIIVGGLGIGASGTAEALAKLPGPVTFAFAPYGSDVDRLAARARSEGHEVLLQVPMEPFDYPDNDPGPHTLLTSLASEQNIDRLYWLMSRLQGYVGIANYMGARFTATDASFAPILREIAKRGLLYVDDGTSPRSLAGQIAGANTMAFAKADVVLDAVPTPAEIDHALVRLETVAGDHGFAIGMASAALPVVIERLSAWVKSAEGRGFALVPVTAVATKPKSS